MLATPTPQPAASAAPVPTPQPVAGTVSDAANLRSGPGTSYAVVGKAQAGDSVSVVGRSADGEWYKLADGGWIAAFLMDVEGADSLPVADAPSAADSWPRYEMITGDFSFAYPPQFSVAEEEEASVTLDSGPRPYAPMLYIGTLQTDVAPISDHEAAVRQLKTMLTQINNFDHRFLDDGVIDAERGGVYVTGVASQDDVDLDFMTALVPVDTSYMFALYLRYGSADIAAEALPIITEIARSIQVPSSTSASTAAAAPSGVEAADQPSLGGALLPTLAATPLPRLRRKAALPC